MHMYRYDAIDRRLVAERIAQFRDQVRRRLSGELEVGLPESVLATANSPHFESLFVPDDDGFRWITVRLGGTMSAPTDNFWELYQNAKIKPKPDERKGPSFEELTKPE